jgi:hypothetical protein
MLGGTAPEGFLENQITVQTNDRRLKSFPISFHASIERSLKMSPPSIALGVVKPNEPISQRLTITAKKEFKLMAIESELAEIHCDLAQEAKRVHMLNLVILPKPSQLLIGEAQGKVLIRTDSTTDEPIEIPLTFSIETEKFAKSPPL